MLVFLMKSDEEKIVLFDGICNYCNAMVNLAIRNDKKEVLKFGTLQSETGKQLKSKYSIPSEITVYSSLKMERSIPIRMQLYELPGIFAGPQRLYLA